MSASALSGSGGGPAGAGAGAGAGGGSSAAAPASILGRSIPSGEATVSASAFAFLFSEMVQYCQGRVGSVVDFEQKLDELGYDVGYRMLELLMYREKAGKRETTVVGLLQFVSSNLWRTLFGKPADALEKSRDGAATYMIRDASPLTDRFVSVPSDYGQLNVSSYIGGIIHGALDAADFTCTVTAHTMEGGGTVFVIKFDPDVMSREAAS